MIGIIATTDAILRKSGALDSEDRKRNQQQAEVFKANIRPIQAASRNTLGKVLPFSPTMEQLLRASLVVTNRRRSHA